MKVQAIIICLLVIISILIGAMINQHQKNESMIAWWKQYARGCSVVAEKQDEVIKSLLK